MKVMVWFIAFWVVVFVVVFVAPFVRSSVLPEFRTSSIAPTPAPTPTSSPQTHGGFWCFNHYHGLAHKRFVSEEQREQELEFARRVVDKYSGLFSRQPTGQGAVAEYFKSGPDDYLDPAI